MTIRATPPGVHCLKFFWQDSIYVGVSEFRALLYDDTPFTSGLPGYREALHVSRLHCFSLVHYAVYVPADLTWTMYACSGILPTQAHVLLFSMEYIVLLAMNMVYLEKNFIRWLS